MRLSFSDRKSTAETKLIQTKQRGENMKIKMIQEDGDDAFSTRYKQATSKACMNKDMDLKSIESCIGLKW